MDNKQILVSVLMSTIKIAVTLAVVVMIYKGAMAAYDYGYRLFTEEPLGYGEGEMVSVYIPEDAGVLDVGEILVTKGLIRDAKLFYLQNLISAHRNDLKPGVYEVSTDMDAFEIMDVLGAEEETEE